jgi:hypothetical protein
MYKVLNEGACRWGQPQQIKLLNLVDAYERPETL